LIARCYSLGKVKTNGFATVHMLMPARYITYTANAATESSRHERQKILRSDTNSGKTLAYGFSWRCLLFLNVSHDAAAAATAELDLSRLSTVAIKFDERQTASSPVYDRRSSSMPS